MHWLPSLATAFAILAVIHGDNCACAQHSPGSLQTVDQAETLWKQTRIALAEHASIQAKLIQDINLYDQHLIGSGAYLQGPSRYHWIRLDLAIKAEPHDTILQQRCDGDFLWILRSADGLTRVGKIDVRRVLAASRADGAAKTMPMLGMGGLPKLFDAMHDAMQFDHSRTEKLDGRLMYVLHGEWRRERLVRWLPQQKTAIEAGEAPDLAKLPAAIPDHVLIYLDAGDLFPRRIDYRRADRQAPGGSKSLVLLRFSDVIFDAPVERDEFHYDPGLLPVTDETEQHIHALGLTP